MEKFKELLQNKKYKMAMISIFVVILIISFTIPKLSGDDVFYLNAINGQSFNGQFKDNVFKFINSRYHIWSSRVLIETLLVFFVKHIFIWRIVNVFVLTSFVGLLNIYFNKNRSLNIILMSVFLTILLPRVLFTEAGWIATTLNYLWAATFALIGFLPFYKRINHKKISVWLYIVSFLFMGLASNQEQINACILGLIVVLGAYLIRNKQRYLDLIPFLLLSIGSLVFTLHCPGNKLRYFAEMQHWFPEYGKLSLIRKIELGFSSTGKVLFFDSSLLFLLFFGLIFIIGNQVFKNQILKSLSALPLVMNALIMLFNVNRPQPTAIDKSVNNFMRQFTHFGTNANFHDISSLGADFLILILFLIVCYVLWTFFKNIWARLFAIVIFIMGYLSKFIMAFSPTVWASGNRTGFILYLSVIILILMIVNELNKTNSDRVDKALMVLAPVGIAIFFISIG